MKKILALIVALGMTCALVTGCSEDSTSTNGKTESSSSASSDADSSSSNSLLIEDHDSSEDSSSSDGSSQQDTTQASEKDPTSDSSAAQPADPAMKFEDSYTYKFQQQLMTKTFSLQMEQEIMGTDSKIELVMNGNDFLMRDISDNTSSDQESAYYGIGNVVYMLDGANKQYAKYEGSNDISDTANPVPEGKYEVLSQTEQGGLIAEKLRVTDTNSMGKEVTSEVTYYYDKASGAPKKMEGTDGGVTQTVTILKFEVGPQTIKLPDLTGWTDISNGVVMQ